MSFRVPKSGGYCVEQQLCSNYGYDLIAYVRENLIKLERGHCDFLLEHQCINHPA